MTPSSCLTRSTFVHVSSMLLWGTLSGTMLAAPALADVHEAFGQVTPTNFDAGGAPSRQFHLSPQAYKPHAVIPRTGPTRDMPVALQEDLLVLPLRLRDGKSSDLPALTLGDYLAAETQLDGVIVLHRGAIVLETYPNMRPWQRHFSWSVTKVITSTVLGALVGEGLVDMAAPIERYLPSFADSAWAGTSVRDVANMASGIDCRDSDGYQTASSCVYRMEESLGITAPRNPPQSFVPLMQQMSRHRAAGTRYEYVSANTNLLMLVIEAASGLPFAEAVQTRIWSRIGPEADALVAVNPEGYAYASGGISLRLRDLARFGEVFTAADHQGVLSDAVFDDLQSSTGIAFSADQLEDLRDEFGDDVPMRAAWQWDLIWPDGGAFKSGYSGQGLYVDPKRQLVIAWFGTANDADGDNAMLAISRQLARADALND